MAKDVAHNPSACSQPLSYIEDSDGAEDADHLRPRLQDPRPDPDLPLPDESEDPTVWFQCKVDRKKFKRCSSPKTFKSLKPGRHTIQVRARDTAGNKEAKAVKRKFKIVR